MTSIYRVSQSTLPDTSDPIQLHAEKPLSACAAHGAPFFPELKSRINGSVANVQTREGWPARLTELDSSGLAIGGEKSLGEVLSAQMKSVARDVTLVVLKNTGHWILEENTRETTDALAKFL
jgi:hypothetical protein